MPLYEYECERHGSFDLMRPMSESGAAGDCPTCGSASPRVLTVPHLFSLTPLQRDAAFRNEKSRHEPHVCTSGCGHRDGGGTKAAGKRGGGGGGKGASGRSGGDPSKPKLQAYTGPRPWVVEHR